MKDTSPESAHKRFEILKLAAQPELSTEQIKERFDLFMGLVYGSTQFDLVKPGQGGS